MNRAALLTARVSAPVRLVLETAALIALLVVAAPASPGATNDALAAPVASLAYLFAAVALLARWFSDGKSTSSAARRRAAVRCAVIGALAANEELLWRRVVLCELLRWGVAAAWGGSSVAFALGHRSRPGLHVATGALFGGLYLATGALAVCVCAHWSYNLLVDRALAQAGRT